MIPAEQWATAWSEHPSTTEQQAALAEADLEKWLAGAPHAAFDPFRKLLTPIVGKFQSFLEIGSGWGGYCQVLKHIDATVSYHGFDISQHMVEYARQKWGSHFTYADSECLPLNDGVLDVVCLSGLIQHLADYRQSIKEAARVSRRWVMLHRVEATSGPNEEFIRRAYDSDVPTRRVNEDELLFFCGLCGLTIKKREQWSVTPKTWNSSYLLEKK